MRITARMVEDILDALGIPEAGKQYVRDTRDSPPSRRVTSSKYLNTTWRYVSEKMAHIAACESTLEKRFAMSCEFDNDVLEYWDQPPSVTIRTPNRKGRKCEPYTPDFLVITSFRIWIAQVKPQHECEKKAQKYQDEWRTRNDGSWEHLPAQEFFGSLGLEHSIVTERTICPVLTENLELIHRTLRLPPPEQSVYQGVANVLHENPALSLAELAGRMEIKDMSPLIQLIGAGAIVGDLERRLLTSPHTFLVAADAQCLRDALYLRTELPTEPFTVAPQSKDGLAAANRLQQLRGERELTVSKRTRSRWKKAYHATGSITSLTPNHRNKGNREDRQKPWHKTLIEEVLNTKYATPLSITPAAAYRFYLLSHSEANERAKQHEQQPPIAKSTFYRRVRSLDKQEMAGRRGGNRSANAARAPVDPALRDIPPNRPFERAHIDHQLIDIHVVVAADDDGPICRSPWLTAMRDEYTGMILGHSLSFRSPSRRACCMVLRDCARTHARLPETIIADKGSEFGSKYFETTLANLGVYKQNRPPGAPRFGAPIESAFGSVKSYLEALPGNKRNDGMKRSISASHKGAKHATLDFGTICHALADYFAIFNSHGINRLQSPEQLQAEGLTLHPASGNEVTFNCSFLSLTAPDLKKRLRLDSARGLRHKGRYYRHPMLNTLNDGTAVTVFEEPWDSNLLYALVNHTLVTCQHKWACELTAAETASQAFLEIPEIECTDVKRHLVYKKELRMARSVVEVTAAANNHSRARKEESKLSVIRLPKLEGAPSPYELEETQP